MAARSPLEGGAECHGVGGPMPPPDPTDDLSPPPPVAPCWRCGGPVPMDERTIHSSLAECEECYTAASHRRYPPRRCDGAQTDSAPAPPQEDPAHGPQPCEQVPPHDGRHPYR